jgi:hypothetical protein
MFLLQFTQFLFQFFVLYVTGQFLLAQMLGELINFFLEVLNVYLVLYFLLLQFINHSYVTFFFLLSVLLQLVP